MRAASIREQAERDGLKVMTPLWLRLAPPRSPKDLSARLLSPDGTEFNAEFGKGGAWRHDRYEQAMLAELG